MPAVSSISISARHGLAERIPRDNHHRRQRVPNVPRCFSITIANEQAAKLNVLENDALIFSYVQADK